MLTEKKPDGAGLRNFDMGALTIGRTITQKTWERVYGAILKLSDYEKLGLEPDQLEDLLYEVQWAARSMERAKKLFEQGTEDKDIYAEKADQGSGKNVTKD